MANLITRGFGALQRIITRGFFSASPPSEDCYSVFSGKIEGRPEILQGKIQETFVLQGKINNTLVLNGIIKEYTVLNGGLCCDS